eukprot:gene26499-biopygen16681
MSQGGCSRLESKLPIPARFNRDTLPRDMISSENGL